jgi:hypothetical protein
MGAKVIRKGDTILAKVISSDWEDGLSFYSDNCDFVQVGTWSYNAGKELPAHIHNNIERNVHRTQEVLYIRKGSIEASIYDAEGNLIERTNIKEGDVIVLINGGHGYKILEDDTQVLEIKNGPYFGAEADRRRI